MNNLKYDALLLVFNLIKRVDNECDRDPKIRDSDNFQRESNY